jgi:hypothetical protein
MKLGSKPGLAAGLAALVLAAPASAAPVTVNMRIEGASTTHFEGVVTTDARATIDGGSGPHPCDGTNKGAAAPVPTAGAALATASEQAPFSFAATWFGSGADDYFLNTVQGETPDFNATQTFWSLFVNGTPANTGMCGEDAYLRQGDDILWAVTDGDDPLLAISGPTGAHRGDAVSVSVVDRATGAVVPDARLVDPRTGSELGRSGSDGTASIALTRDGTWVLKARKDEFIASPALTIQVVAPGESLPPSGGAAAPDRLAPLARLLGIADHQTFRKGKGPRTLKASVSDASGLAAVKLRLTRRSGGRCFYFSGRRQELERTRCGRAFFFKAGDSPDVSYLLPERLGPGRYVLDLAAVDRAGNRSALARGSTRVVFTVR